MGRKLPVGYRIYAIDCPHNECFESYALMFRGSIIDYRCAVMEPVWWTVWRLKSKARAFARRGVHHLPGRIT